VRQLLGKEPDVERVEHRSHARRAQIELEMALRVPGEGRDPVAFAYPKRLERAAEAVDPFAQLLVGDPRGSVVGERHDLAVAVNVTHPVQDVLDRQLIVVLHRAAHQSLTQRIIPQARGSSTTLSASFASKSS